jgi:hypothetical protein
MTLVNAPFKILREMNSIYMQAWTAGKQSMVIPVMTIGNLSLHDTSFGHGLTRRTGNKTGTSEGHAS